MGAGRTLQQATTSTNFNSLRHRATQQTKTRSIHLLTSPEASSVFLHFVRTLGRTGSDHWGLLDDLILELRDSLG